MPGVKLLTKLDPQTCLKLAWRAAQDLGYSVTPIEDSSKRFTAKKGNFLLGALTGPLAPHCHFEVTVHGYPDATEVMIDKNTPWFTSGAIGVSKVNRQAEELLGAMAAAIEKAGAAILERKEF